MAAIQLKTKCPGCGEPARIVTADGPHLMELLPWRHDAEVRRAAFVRRVLAQAGIDPASWGYPPLAGDPSPKPRGMPQIPRTMWNIDYTPRSAW